MSRLTDAWRAMEPEQRLASVASVALLVTMFFPWYGLQSLNRKTGAISSHTINAFGDVSFVEAAVFLVAAGVVVMMLARTEARGGRGCRTGAQTSAPRTIRRRSSPPRRDGARDARIRCPQSAGRPPRGH